LFFWGFLCTFVNWFVVSLLDMKSSFRYLIALICVSVLTTLASAQGYSGMSEGKDPSIIEKFSIYYKVDSIDINPRYLDNRRQIEHILHYLDNSPRIDSITIYAWASPEGPYRYNKWLSRERARTAKAFLLKHSPDSAALNAGKIKISPIAENWTGLRRLVEADYHRSDREKVIQILDDRSIGDQTRKARLQKLDRGRSWRYMIRNYMPELRAATWVCVWAEAPPVLPRPAVVKDTLRHFSGGIIPVPPSPRIIERKRTILGLKTNMLYDVATALNFAVEVPINEHFSFQYEHHCPWWLSRNNRYCLEFLSFGGEFRWWFLPKTHPETDKRKQRDALSGHFLGIHGWGGKADIQANRDFGCYQFEFFSAGLTYGYSMPISRYLNLEFSISAGYARIPYRHYIPTPDWEILIRDRNDAGTLHYFGPTKAEISLVIPIRVKIGGGQVDEAHDLHIGRHPDSAVFLRKKAVA